MLSRFYTVFALIALTFLAGCANSGGGGAAPATPMAAPTSHNASSSAATMISPATQTAY